MEPVGYDQILREVAAKRKLKPWEIAMPGRHVMPDGQMMADSEMRAESPQATGAAQMAAVDPLAMAARRTELMQALGQLGGAANPETQMENQGQRPNPGLLQLLMGLMRK